MYGTQATDADEFMRTIHQGEIDRRERKAEKAARVDDTELPIAIWSGSFRLFGVDLKCHTLSNGTRIIEHDSMLKLMAQLANPIGDVSECDVDGFARWRAGVDEPEVVDGKECRS